MRNVLLTALLAMLPALLPAAPLTDAATRALARDVLRELVEINTTESSGNVTAAAQAMAARLRAGGFEPNDVAVVGALPRKLNLVARLRGTGKARPLLLIGHLDVVEARREDWSVEPFHFIEKDGFYYGRGTQDMKDGDAILVATLVRLKQENFRPERDLILALTADEEAGDANGLAWLLANRRDLVAAEYGLNHDGTGVETDHGRAVVVHVGLSEKVYADFELAISNRGGRSSVPQPDNAIYELAAALGRLERYQFPFEMNAAVRAHYEALLPGVEAARAAGLRRLLALPPDAAALAQLSAQPDDYSQTHTTCVATRLAAGDANNALAQRATATVNCRILPGHEPEEVRQDLIRVLAEPKLTVRYLDDAGHVQDDARGKHGFAVAAVPEPVLAAVRIVAASMWPGAAVIPTMGAYASDAAQAAPYGLRVFQVSGDACEVDDHREHGQDERIGVEAFARGVDFYYRFLHALLGKH